MRSFIDEVIPLGMTGDYINGLGFKESDWGNEGLPIIRIQNLTNPTKPFNRTLRSVEGRYKVNDGDILVSWSATLDVFVWRRGPALLNQHIFKVVPDTTRIDPIFLFYQLKSIIWRMSHGEHAHGSTMKHINRKPFLAYPFWCPPLNRQREIAQALDRNFSGVESCEKQFKNIHAKLKQARASILKAAVEGRLVRHYHASRMGKESPDLDALSLLEEIRLKTEEYLGKQIKRRKETRLQEEVCDIPSNWCFARLSDLGVFGRGKSRHRPRNDPRLFGGPFPFIQTGEIAACRGRITNHAYTYSDFGISQSKLWPKYTLCITIAANIANTGILQFDACFPDSVVGLYCPLCQSIVKYAEIFIGSIKDKLEDLAPATAQKNT